MAHSFNEHFRELCPWSAGLKAERAQWKAWVEENCSSHGSQKAEIKGESSETRQPSMSQPSGLLQRGPTSYSTVSLELTHDESTDEHRVPQSNSSRNPLKAGDLGGGHSISKT